METTYSYTIDDRSVHVLDSVLSADQVTQLNDRFARAAFVRDESDGPDKAHVRTFNTDVDLAEFATWQLAKQAPETAAALFPGRELTLYRVHCNLTIYGDMGFPHQDCASDRNDVTVLIFVNAEWRTEWGGELTFFNAAGDAVHAITPRPGRMLVFEGALAHRVGIPMRECYESRLTLAVKFKTPGTWR
ncbi:2OG-Fe(II) oxygenase [Dactylosporangium sp. NPDC051484]|uniref:2OG-Fe(II) oxygenase n=1 Tax=Dactylosporangium sp. NPDC051484 TaxID=3154942 RepID=UPI00344C0F4C